MSAGLSFIVRLRVIVCALALCAPAIWAVDVTLTSDAAPAIPTGTTVNFTATATGVNRATTYTFAVIDGNFATIYGPTTGLNSTFTYTFATQDEFTVTVDVNNGIDPHATDFLYVEAVTIPPASDPPGVNAGDPALPNPDTGDTIALSDVRDGVIQGSISNAKMAPTDYFTSTFGDPVDTNADGRIGSTLLHHYTNSGIFILESDRLDAGGSMLGKSRKTLCFSDNEIAPDPTSTIVAPPASGRKFTFKKLKGKFNFTKPGTSALHKSPGGHTGSSLDTVTLSWQMTLPVGFDVQFDTQNVMIGVGNVVETVSLNPSGAGVITQPSPYKAVRIKLPHLKGGNTVVSTSYPSTVNVTLSAAGLTGLGFDTEGISPLARTATNPGPLFDRKIQVATYFAGVSYGGIANVKLSVSSNLQFGTISGRH